MKIITKRKIEKYEEVELEFTQWDALELVSRSRFHNKKDYFETEWNGLFVSVEKYGNIYMIAISDDNDLYKRFDVSFTFEEK